MATIRVAMLSFWHVHAKDYAKLARENPATEIVAVWDELPARGQAEAAERGARFYADLDELLAQPEIDAVIVDAPTTMHRAVMVAAARAGKHIFTEKVVATTLRECNEIVAAVDEAGVKLTVSLPRLYEGSTVAIKEVIDRALLGELTLVRTRLSHNGGLPVAGNPNGWLPAHFYNHEQTGGGAMIDLGCHPMYLARLFLGALPESVSARYGYVTGREVEDNAVSLLQYLTGAIGVVEAGFVNPHSPFTIEIHGTEGSLFYGTPESDLIVHSGRHDGTERVTRKANLPADQPPAFEQWVAHIQQGTTATDNIQAAIDLTTLMEASTIAAREGRAVRLDSLAR